MTTAGDDVDQQTQLVRFAERTARASETIATTLLAWSAVAFFVGLFLLLHAIAS